MGNTEYTEAVVSFLKNTQVEEAKDEFTQRRGT